MPRVALSCALPFLLANVVAAQDGFTDACSLGFSATASGAANTAALQKAVDGGGTVIVSRPGTYALAGTVYLGSDTTLQFGNGVRVRKVAEAGPFTQVFANKGALTRTMDHHIVLDGLTLEVNGVDHTAGPVLGLRGQVGFFYVQDLRISHFRCADLGKGQYGIQVCTFEDLVVDDVDIAGGKDGVHLGRGKRYRIDHGVFRTGDDAIALNGHDYATGNPELGWIEDGLITDCHDLDDGTKPIGFFVRILAGAWIDWKPGMVVQNSDSVVSEGRVYRVKAKPDKQTYTSTTRPTHASGIQVLDGISWAMAQTEPVHTAGVRNVTFRDIHLYKQRPGFSIHFDADAYSRSYYPGAEVPVQQGIHLDQVYALYSQPMTLLKTTTPIDAITMVNSTLRNATFLFRANSPVEEALTTRILLNGCTFLDAGPVDLVVNTAPRKVIDLRIANSLVMEKGFAPRVVPGEGTITVDADLGGLRPDPVKTP